MEVNWGGTESGEGKRKEPRWGSAGRWRPDADAGLGGAPAVGGETPPEPTATGPNGDDPTTEADGGQGEGGGNAREKWNGRGLTKGATRTQGQLETRGEGRSTDREGGTPRGGAREEGRATGSATTPATGPGGGEEKEKERP